MLYVTIKHFHYNTFKKAQISRQIMRKTNAFLNICSYSMLQNEDVCTAVHSTSCICKQRAVCHVGGEGDWMRELREE